MCFKRTAIDVSVYQGEIDWPRVKAAGIYAAVLRAGYGMYAHQKDLRFDANYAGARAAGLPVGVYWFSYANTPEEAVLEAQICLQVLTGRELQMPLYFDQEENDIPAANRTACAVAFLDYIRAHSSYVPGYYSYTAYFASVDIPTIQAHADTIWLADYRANYNKDIPRDMHQYTSSGTVAGITGRVDMNHLYRDFPRELGKEDKPLEFINVKNKAVQVTADDNVKGTCEVFSAMDVNAVVGKLERGSTTMITTMATEDSYIVGSTKGRWVTLENGNFVAVISPLSQIVEVEEPEVPTVDLSAVMAALSRIESTQAEHTKQLTGLTDSVTKIADKQTAAGAALSK